MTRPARYNIGLWCACTYIFSSPFLISFIGFEIFFKFEVIAISVQRVMISCALCFYLIVSLSLFLFRSHLKLAFLYILVYVVLSYFLNSLFLASSLHVLCFISSLSTNSTTNILDEQHRKLIVSI